MNTPYSVVKKKLQKGKESTTTEWRSNSDRKKEYMETYHLKTEAEYAERTRNFENWSRFIEPSFPSRFQWIWFQFLDIWRTCSRDFNGNVVFTPRVLIDYCECFKVSLTVYEKRLLFRIKTWAEDEIYKLREKK